MSQALASPLGIGLPADWPLLRLKRIASVRPSNVDKKSDPDEESVRLCNYTDVYYGHRIHGDLDLMTATAPSRQISRFSLQRGDVIVTKDSESRTDIAVPAYVPEDLPGVVCGYHLALIRPLSRRMDGRFLHYAFLADAVRDQFHNSATGITRFGLSTGALQNAWFPVPDLHLQRTIADFLDRETTHIDTLVEQKERLIELLDEKRSALITHAVTKGLDPDVPMKDSGVEWIGEIPEHWGTPQLQHLVASDRPIMYGIVLPGPNVDGGVPIIKGGNVAKGRLRPGTLSRTDPEIEIRHARSRVKPGDLVYSIRGSYGDVAVVPESLNGANLTQDAARVSPREGVSISWLQFVLASRPVFASLDAGALGATISGINIRDLKRVRIPTPPEPEARELARSLEESTTQLNNALRMITSSITLLRERRSALITAAVTGQIDVSEYANE